jgi:O-antigen ligase
MDLTCRTPRVLSIKGLFFLYLVFAGSFYALIGLLLPETATSSDAVPPLLKALRDMAFLGVLYLFLLRVLLEKHGLWVDSKLFPLVCLYAGYVFVGSLRFLIGRDIWRVFDLLLANRNTLEYIPLIFLVQHIIRTKSDLLSFTRFMLVLFVALALFGFFQFTLGYVNPLYEIADRSGAVFRNSGTFNNPGMFGLTVNLGIILLLSLAGGRKKLAFCGKHRVVYYLLAVFLIVCSVSSGSVTSVLALAGGLCVLFLLEKKMGFIIVLIVSLGIAWFSLSGKIVGVLSLSTPTASLRLMLWKEAWARFLASPLMGYGTGSYGATAGTLEFNQITDNYYLSMLLQNGIVGFAVFSLIVLTVMIRALSLLRTERDPEVRKAGYGWTACLVVLLVANFSGDFSEAFPANVWFWLIIGVLARYPCFRAQTQRV